MNIQCKRKMSSINDIEKTGRHMQKNKTGPVSYMVHKKSTQNGLKT